MPHATVYHSLTDVGRDRELNEDSYGEFELEDGSVLLVVCDGMGGHEGGEVASRIAVEAIGDIFLRSPSTDPREKLINGFRVANQRILTEAERTGVEGMGTTAVAVYAAGDRFTTAHVGDSRVYQVRDGEVVWRTTDHTRVQKMVEKGIISQAEAKEHPDANVVTRALGYRETADGEPIEADVGAKPLRMQPGDALVLCSDGLYDGVTDDEIAATVTGVDVESAAVALVDFANRRGGHDNITVSVLRYGDEAPRAAAAPAKKKSASGRTTDLDEPEASEGDARQTELDESTGAAGARKRAAAPGAEASPPHEDKKRRTAAILMLLVAAAIVALVVYLLFGRGGSDDEKPPATDKGATGATPAGTGGSTDSQSASGAATGTSRTPGGTVDDAPPLPENPVTGPRRPGRGADEDAGLAPGELQPPDPDDIQVAPSDSGRNTTVPPSMTKSKKSPAPAPKKSPDPDRIPVPLNYTSPSPAKTPAKTGGATDDPSDELQ